MSRLLSSLTVRICLSLPPVGTAQVMLPVDYYAGTHLRFIFLNVVRRATQPTFSQALLEPPLDTEATCFNISVFFGNLFSSKVLY